MRWQDLASLFVRSALALLVAIACVASGDVDPNPTSAVRFYHVDRVVKVKDPPPAGAYRTMAVMQNRTIYLFTYPNYNFWISTWSWNPLNERLDIDGNGRTIASTHFNYRCRSVVVHDAERDVFVPCEWMMMHVSGSSSGAHVGGEYLQRFPNASGSVNDGYLRESNFDDADAASFYNSSWLVVADYLRVRVIQFEDLYDNSLVGNTSRVFSIVGSRSQGGRVDGTGVNARLQSLTGIVCDRLRGVVYAAANEGTMYRIVLAPPYFTTTIGSPRLAGGGRSDPIAMIMLPEGDLLVGQGADRNLLVYNFNVGVQQVGNTGYTTTFSTGSGPVTTAQFGTISSLFQMPRNTSSSQVQFIGLDADETQFIMFEGTFKTLPLTQGYYNVTLAIGGVSGSNTGRAPNVDLPPNYDLLAHPYAPILFYVANQELYSYNLATEIVARAALFPHDYIRYIVLSYNATVMYLASASRYIFEVNATDPYNVGSVPNIILGAGYRDMPPGEGCTQTGSTTCTIADPTSPAIFDRVMMVFGAHAHNRILLFNTSSRFVRNFVGSGIVGRGDGVGLLASFRAICGGTTDITNTTYYVLECQFFLRRVTLATATVNTIGDLGVTDHAYDIRYYADIMVNRDNTLLVCDNRNHRLYLTNPTGTIVRFVMGTKITQFTTMFSGMNDSFAYEVYDMVGLAAFPAGPYGGRTYVSFHDHERIAYLDGPLEDSIPLTPQPLVVTQPPTSVPPGQPPPPPSPAPPTPAPFFAELFIPKDNCSSRPVTAKLLDNSTFLRSGATWARVVPANLIRDEGLTFTFAITSCHKLNDERRSAASQNASDYFGFQLIGKETGPQSLLSLTAGPQRLIRQTVRSEGKILEVSIGPLPVYSPRVEDEIIFHWRPQMFEDLSPEVQVRRQASSINNGSDAPFDVMVNVVSSRLFQSPGVGTVTSGGTSVIGGGSVIGGPGMAAAANRQALLSNAADCPSVFSAEPIERSEHPLGFGIGPSQFRYHLGTLAGNSLIAVALIALHFLFGMVIKLFAGCSTRQAMEHVRFPARSLPVLSYLMQPTLTSTIVVASYSPELQHNIACAAVAGASLLIIAGTGWVLVSWKPPRFDVYYWYKPHDPNRSWHSRLTYCTGYYLPRSMARMSFVKMMGPIFEDYNPEVRYFFFVDLLIMAVSAYIVAVFPETEADCEYTFLATIAVFACYVLVAAVTRPMTAVIANIAFVATAASQFLAAASLYVAFKTDSQVVMTFSDIFSLVSIALQILNLVYSFVKGVVELWTGDDQNTKVTRQAQRLFELRRERSETAAAKGLFSVYRE